MPKYFFENTFKRVDIPVIVCRNVGDLPIIFSNNSARLLLNPFLNREAINSGQPVENMLSELLIFDSQGSFDGLIATTTTLKSVSGYRTCLVDFEGRRLPVSISSNLVELSDEEYLVFYLHTTGDGEARSDPAEEDLNRVVTNAFHIAYDTPDVDAAIDRLLAYVGTCVGVSRVYVFEEESVEYTRNTYEWCADGVTPAIGDLQHLRKADYNYDEIVNGGMYITDDIRELPRNDYDILAAQGIKSLAIIPLTYADSPLGYVGFDDCDGYRKWTSMEINLLSDVANILSSLIVRRDAEARVSRSLDILQTISDNIDSIVYVSDINTYELVFLNKALADSLGKKPEELIGKPCWAVLQKGMDGPCPFCPIRQLVDRDGNITSDTYTWEFQNTVSGKWYLVKDDIIKWVDGRDIHIETATEITHRKIYEEQLKHYASIDMMTGAYNREFGYTIMEEMRQSAIYDSGTSVSLVFIDIDGLKIVNDTFGHDSGDTMIIKIVETIRSNVRQSDVLCRWGGDEFILLLQCDNDVASRIMGGIEKKLDDFNKTGELPFDLAMSYGITSLNETGEDSIDAIITLADKRMYASKMAKRS